MADFLFDQGKNKIEGSPKTIIDAMGLEIEGVREGADGKEYNTAGEAVREQFNTVNNSVNGIENLSSINVNVTLSNVNTAIKYSDGSRYNSSGFTATEFIDIHAYKRIVYSRITATVSNPAHGMAFYDSEQNYISGISSIGDSESGYENYTVDIPNGAYYARFTTRSDTETYGNFLLLYSYDLLNKINEFNTDINEMSDILSLNDSILNYSLLNNNTGIRYTDGYVYTSNGFTATGYIDIHRFKAIVYTRILSSSSKPTHGMAFYDSEQNYISGIASLGNSEIGYENYTVDIPNGAYYARFTTRSDTQTYGNFSISGKNFLTQFVENEITESNKKQTNNVLWLPSLVELPQKNNGVFNVVARMRMLTDISWLPKKPVPKQYRNELNNIVYGQFNANEKVVGIPYGAQLTFEQWIGKVISFETFVSSLFNENSVIYNFSRVGHAYRQSAWYSINCSKAVGWALNIKRTYATGQFRNDPNINIIKTHGNYTIDDIQIGDILENPSEHTAIITDIIFDDFGEVSQIEVSEAVTPSCRRLKWYISGYINNFFDHFENYDLLRYELINEVPPANIENLFPYISKTLGLDYGNKSNYKLNDDIKINIFNKISNSINFSINGVAQTPIDVSTTSEGSEIVFTPSIAGWYEFNFANGDKIDSVTCCVVDDSASLNSETSVLTFSSNTGVLNMISYCRDSSRIHISDEFPTATDIENGYMTLTIPSNADYLHILFLNNFGKTLIEIEL